MREHQIVITLKPDQFLEVQRLARAANSKSMGAFVRQKLLAALGIEGTIGDELSGGNTAAQQVDVDAILADLKRVHGELKAFVAESLSPYSPEAFEQTQFDEQSSQLTLFDTTVSNVVPDNDEQVDELEKVAERTFAISPRLGSIGDTRDADLDSSYDPRSYVANHEVHHRRDVHRHQVADPLSKLLTSEDMAVKPKPKAPSINDDDLFDVPLSLAERSRLMEMAEREQAGHYEPEIPDESYLEEDVETDETDAVGDQPYYEEQQESYEEPQPEPISEEELSLGWEEPETQASTASEDTAGAPPNLGRPLGYPPLSGSPPPKRRQV